MEPLAAARSAPFTVTSAKRLAKPFVNVASVYVPAGIFAGPTMARRSVAESSSRPFTARREAPVASTRQRSSA